MDSQFYNGFCPNCGALLRDGVCPSCGYGETQQPVGTDAEITNQDLYGNNTAETSSNPGGEQQQQPRNYEIYQNNYMNNGGSAGGTDFDNSQGNYYQNNQNNQNGYYQNNNGQNGYYQNGAGQNQYYQNGTGQNQYYQNGNGQGGYYQANGNGYYGQPPKKKSSTGAVIAICLVVALILLVIIGVAGTIIISELGLDESEYNENSYDYNYDDYDYDDYGFDDYDDYDDYDYDDDDYDYDDYDDYDYDEMMRFVDDIEWNDKNWKKEPYNYEPDEVGDDYYYEMCNCIDEDVSYQFVYENFEELDKDLNVCVRINYYQLEGDIPNLDEINKTLKQQAMWAGERYLSNKGDFEYEFEKYGAGYVATVESYITYNDDQTVSMVSDIYYESATEVNKVINCTNVDLITGTVIRNTDILDITDEFLDDYRDICEEQNGEISVFTVFDNDDLREFFEDEENLIIYYTPCGLETGINYSTSERYGWVTATLTDYEQYMKSY